MNFKDTLLMPQTDFPMKANLTTKEVHFRESWHKARIYEKVLAKNKDNQHFILHDGPLYANGDLHVGHALNRILKDIVVRRKNMEGFYAPFVNGWDMHGLPIELKMLEQRQLKRENINKITLRKEAARFAVEQMQNQRQQLLQMQLFSPLDNVYCTFDKEFEVAQLKLFKKMVFDGLIYKGLKPIYWSPSSQSALAEAEVEYKDHRAPEVIVALEVTAGTKHLPAGAFLLVMTTTPWTLVANAGVAVHCDFRYVVVLANGQKYVVASDRLAAMTAIAKWDPVTVLATISGKDLRKIQYRCPIKKDRTAPVVMANFVSLETGTGLVHMAPLFGEDDYLMGKQHNLEMIMHVDDRGFFNDAAGDYAGLFYEAANKVISMQLQAEQRLVASRFIKHSYPHDWRTGKPVIYRGVPQWFVNIKPIKATVLETLATVRSIPAWGTKRLHKMIQNRDEWTISRQRTWGVPLIIFYDKLGKPLLNPELFDHVIALVAQNGTDVWWEKTTDELLPPAYRNRGITREMDIMDVWFDSGSTSVAVPIAGRNGPFDLYLEGNDQYRGWFNSSLINSVAYRKASPFQTLISHGFVLDKNHEKMSKSKGNVVDALQIICDHGAEILRLWVANAEYTADVSISPAIVSQTSELYRKLRNWIRFMLGNLADFDIHKHAVKPSGLHRYIAQKIAAYHHKIKASYDNYEFKAVVKTTSKLLADLSSWYFNYAKDVLYCETTDYQPRRMVQTNLFNMLLVVLIALAPVLPTTAEEAYQAIPNYNAKESIFLAPMPVVTLTDDFDPEWVRFEKEVRPLVNNLIENQIQAGKAKRSNELILHLEKKYCSPAYGPASQMAQYLMVAKVVPTDKASYLETFVSEKCLRCWNHFHGAQITNKICKRCKKVLEL